MQLNFISKSISVEVSKFLARFHFSRTEKDVSKQAFSKARQHVKWEGYVHLNEQFVKEYYSDNDFQKYKGEFVLLGSDGTNYQLPYEKELIKEFGTHDNGQGQAICMAQGGKIYDLLNQITLLSAFNPYNSKDSKGNSEKAIFKSHLTRLPQLIDNELHRVVLVGDKYYPSFYYFHQLPLMGYNYVFRCKAKLCLELIAFSESNQEDITVEIDLTIGKRQYKPSIKSIVPQPKSLSVRFVKILLSNGEVEYLATNISKEELSISELGEVYGIRWNQETSFDTDKNKLEVENLSSKSPNGVRQDFHAKILASNITELLVSDAQEQSENQQIEKDNKHVYQINKAVAIGLIKDELPKLFFGYEPSEIWYDRMLKKIIRRKEPVRPGRHYEKEKKHNLKYHITKRRVT